MFYFNIDLIYIFSYDELGNTCGTPRFTALKPIKLKWNISEGVTYLIQGYL